MSRNEDGSLTRTLDVDAVLVELRAQRRQRGLWRGPVPRSRIEGWGYNVEVLAAELRRRSAEVEATGEGLALLADPGEVRDRNRAAQVELF